MLQRKKPLSAKKPLARGTKQLARLGRIKSISQKRKESTPEWNAVVDQVRQRAHGHCENCGKGLLPGAGEPHHVFKRNNRIPRKWADLPELVAWICHPCHRWCEEHPRAGVQRHLEWVGVGRLARRLSLDLAAYATDNAEPLWTPLQITRDLIRKAEEAAPLAA